MGENVQRGFKQGAPLRFPTGSSLRSFPGNSTGVVNRLFLCGRATCLSEVLPRRVVVEI